MDEAMAAAKAAAAEGRDVPEGYELVAVEDRSWRLAAGKRCRFGASKGHPACGRPSVAELNRRYHGWKGADQIPNWWAYCDNPDHLYSRWIEDGKIMHWVLREIGDDDG